MVLVVAVVVPVLVEKVQAPAVKITQVVLVAAVGQDALETVVCPDPGADPPLPFSSVGACTTVPVLLNNEITAGDGGNGGDGGDGGVGGLGGLGGVGGASNKSVAFCSRDGGYGGDGGFGGDGGGGGGGAGGNSFAVYVEGFTPDPLWVSADNDLDAGLPGLGGRGGEVVLVQMMAVME